MTIAGSGAHILVIPFPAQGHMIALLDLTHELAIRGLTITILVTPQNLPLLNPFLSQQPSIKTLVLPFPTHPSIPAGVENSKDLPPNTIRGFRAMMHTLGDLYQPVLDWFHTHPSPPVAIVSDFFLGWTHHLACHLNIHRIVFSPSGALALAVIYSLWRDLPNRGNPIDLTAVVSFPKIPNSPKYPWSQLSAFYRSHVEGDPESEFIKDGFRANLASWGLVINSFSELEHIYMDNFVKELGHDRVWAVGPLHLLKDKDLCGVTERGGSSSVLATKMLTWLDTCDDHKVVYVCFGSHAVLTNKQIEEMASGLEKSGVRFIWSVKVPTKGHVEGDYGMIPSGFEDRVAGRGLVIKEWAPQVLILRHRAVGAFLTHCGWNSILEGLVAGVPMLAWPMGAEQFMNATLLVDELKVAVRICEGAQTVPDSAELGRVVADSVSEKWAMSMRERVMELRKAALQAVKEGGSSYKDLDGLVKQLSGLELRSSSLINEHMPREY